MKKVWLFASASMLILTSRAATNSTWSSAAVDNLWTNTLNWSTGIPPSSGDKARFDSAGNGFTNISLATSSGTTTVYRMEFGSASAAPYTIGTGGPGAQDLVLEANGWVDLFDTVVNEQVIDANIYVGDTVSDDYKMNNYSTNVNLILRGNIYRTGGNYVDYFRIQRPGTTELAGSLSNLSADGDLDVVVDLGHLLLTGGSTWDGDLRIINEGSVTVTETATLPAGNLEIQEGAVMVAGDHTVNNFLYFGDDDKGGDAFLTINSNSTLTLLKNPGYYTRYLSGAKTNTALVTGGTLDLGGAARTFNIRDNPLVQAINGTELTIESDIVNTNGAGAKQNIIKSYDGTLRFNADNYTYQKLTINQGKLQVNSFDAVGSGTPNIGNGNGDDPVLEFLSPTDTSKGVNIAFGDMTAGGSTETEGGVILNNGEGKVSFNWNWLNGLDGDPAVARTVTFGGTNALENLFGGIRDYNATGGTLNLVKKDSGKWLADKDNTYSGTTTIEGGTLQLNRRTGLYNGNTGSWTTGNLAVKSNATLTVKTGGTTGFTSGDLDTLLALGGATGGFEDGSTIGIHTGNTNFTYSSVISDPNGGANSLALLKTAGNSLTLDQANTYSGGTTLEEGVLWFTDDDALGTGDILIKDEGTDPVLEFGADGLNLANNIVVSDSGGLKLIRASQTAGENFMEHSGDMVIHESNLGDFRLRVNNPGSAENTLTLSGLISGAGGIGKSGWGKAVLAADNTYTGGTKIIDGMLQIGANGDTGNILGDVEFQGGSGGDELRFARSNDFTFAGNISGDGKVYHVGNEAIETAPGDGKFNSELLILTGSNTYSAGTWVLEEARIQAANDHAFGTGAITLNGEDAGLILENGVTLGNELIVTANARTHIGIDSGTATYDGDISINNNSVWDLHLRPDSGETLVVNGIVQDNGGDGFWVKSSTGTLILNGDNTYTGSARIDGGTAFINGDNRAATGDIDVYNSATLSGGGTIGGAVETFGSSTLTGTLTFTNSVVVSSKLKPGTSPGTMTFGSSLNLQASSTTTLDIAGLGSYDILANDGGDTITFADGATIAFDTTGYTANNGDSFLVLDNWNLRSGTLANLNFAGTNLTGGAYLNVSSLLIDGTVTVVGSATSPASLYSDWTAQFLLTPGVNDGLGDNPDGDAFDNLAEYALGGDPTNKNNTGIPPILWLGDDAGTNWFYYAHAQRSDADLRDLNYEVKQDTDLLSATWAASAELLGTNVTGGAFDSVTNRVPTNTENEQFMELHISTGLE